MKTIHKHRLEVNSEVQELKLPQNGRPLRVDYMVQDGAVQMWVEVDAEVAIDSIKSIRRFKVFSTGDGIPSNARYVGTTVNHVRPDAYHVYELVD